MSRILTPQQKIERSIVTDFRRDIWNKFVMGYERYDMIKPGDKIAVCISGGKDSMLLAKCMQHLQKYQGMDIGGQNLYCNEPRLQRRKQAENNRQCGAYGNTHKMFETKVFDIAYNTKRNPCYLCARMRRGWLYKFMQDLGCNKIALGHHFDDVIETILMSMVYGVTDSDYDAEAALEELRRHGAYQTTVHGERGGHYPLGGAERSAFYPLCLPFH